MSSNAPYRFSSTINVSRRDYRFQSFSALAWNIKLFTTVTVAWNIKLFTTVTVAWSIKLFTTVTLASAIKLFATVAEASAPIFLIMPFHQILSKLH